MACRKGIRGHAALALRFIPVSLCGIGSLLSSSPMLVSPHEVVDVKGESPLAQIMSAVLFGDYVSYYLALLNGIDPSPVAAIDYLKRRLAEV